MKNKQRLWPYTVLAIVAAGFLAIVAAGFLAFAGCSALTVGDGGSSTVDKAPFDVWTGE